MPPPPTTRDLLVANGGLVVMVLLGGGFFPVIERTLQTWDSLSATAARQTVGGLALCLVLAWFEPPRTWLRGVTWWRLALLNLIGMGLSSVFVSMSVAFSDGISAAIVSTANPIMAALIGRVMQGQPLTRAAGIGALLAVAGGVLAIMGSGASVGSIRGGELFMLGAGAIWTWYSIACQRWLAGQSFLAITALTTLPSGLALAVVAGVLGGSGLLAVRVDFSPTALLLLAYAGMLMLGVANWLWHRGVSVVGVTVCTMYTNLMPVAAVLVTMWLGAVPSPAQLAGGAIILAGVLYAQLAAPARAASVAQALVDEVDQPAAGEEAR